MGLPDIESLDLDEFEDLGPSYHSEVSFADGRVSNCNVSETARGQRSMRNLRRGYDNVISRMGTANFDTFGSAVEPSYHSTGHVAIARECSNGDGWGVMAYSAASARDPIFYRWHQHIEDLFEMYKERRGPYTKEDFQLSNGLKVIEVNTIMDKAELGTKNDIENILVTFDEEATVQHHHYRRLNHNKYKYQIKMSNPSRISKKIIVRIFLALGKCLKVFFVSSLKCQKLRSEKSHSLGRNIDELASETPSVFL